MIEDEDYACLQPEIQKTSYLKRVAPIMCVRGMLKTVLEN